MQHGTIFFSILEEPVFTPVFRVEESKPQRMETVLLANLYPAV